MERRTRTGCATCRRRRVKCDEARPTCNRCRTANFHCDGYATPRRASPTSPVASEHASSPERVAIAELAYRHRGFRQEQLPLYHHFVTTTVVRLFRTDHLTFWRDQVAQMSYDVDVVYETLLAIGAVHRSSLISCQEGNGPESARFKVLGLRAYSKTIKLLPSHLGRDLSISDTLTALIVLMLLAYFECFLENPKGAFRHLWAAIQLLRNSEEHFSPVEVSKMAPILDAMIRLDFLAQNLIPYACSSFIQLSGPALMEPPFWNRPALEFTGMSQADQIAAERYRLIQLVCAHNKMNRIVWGPWCVPSERPTQAGLQGFYSEMLLWKENSPATFSGSAGLDTLKATDMAAIEALPLPPPVYFFDSNEAALNVAMYNGYLGCVLAMINATNSPDEASELEIFNLVYQNLCIGAGLIQRHFEKTRSPYKPCDAISMGISIFIYHGARRCFSPAWQQVTITTLKLSGREGLSNGYAFANTVEIMCRLEGTLDEENINHQNLPPNTFHAPIKDRLIPLLMPLGEDDQRLAFFLKSSDSSNPNSSPYHEPNLLITAKATWTQDSAGAMQSLNLDVYEEGDTPNAEELFSSWRQAVQNGWNGYLEQGLQDDVLRRVVVADRRYHVDRRLEGARGRLESLSGC